MDMSVLHKKVNIKITIAILSLEVLAALLSLFLIVYPNINVKPIKAATPNYFSLAADSSNIITKSNPTKALINTTTAKLDYNFGLPTSTTTIPGLAVSATINLLKDDSLARIILVDKSKNEYLVYEAFANLNGKTSFSVNNVCEETCALNNIIPDYFKIQIVNAEVTITGHSYSTSLNSAAKTAGAVVYSKQLKTNQVTDKVVLLNQQLQASGGKWFAGVTTVSLLPNNQLQKMFTKDDGTPVDAVPNLQGLQYYKGGIFEIKNSSLAAKGSPTDSNIIVPDSFDWRNVNGEDWMTPVKTQQGNSCAYYGTVGSYESIINLFYNQHLNIDLSEQMYIDCSSEYLDASLMMTGVNSPIVGLSTSTECTYKSNFCDIKKWGGLADEACDSPQTRVPDSNNKNCNAANICSDWKSRLWGISDYYSYSLNLRQSPAIFPGGESMQDFNKFKSLLIKNGPLMSGYDPWGHVMVLTGYGIIKQGDNAISGSTNWSSMIIPAGSPLIGQTYWMFKNSWGTDWGDSGYGKFVVDFNVDSLQGVFIRGLITPPTNHSYPYWPKINGVLWDGKVACVDKDNDNYCNWGISDQPPTGTVCPTNCIKTTVAPIKFIKDCDDSNNKLGQFTSDNNLNCVLTSIISSTGGSSTNLWVGSTNKTINISGTNLSSSQVPVISLCQILNPTACMNVSYTSYTCLPDGSGCTLKTTALGPNLAANSPLYFTTNHEAGPVEEILPYGKLKICPTIGSTACASYNFYYIPAPAPTITNVVFNNPTLIGSSSYWVGGTTATFTVTGTYLNVGQTPEFRLCRPNDDGTTYGACTTNPIFPNMVYTNCNADGKSCSFTTTIIGPNLNANASFSGFFNGVVSGLKVCPVAGSTACRIVPFNYKPA